MTRPFSYIMLSCLLTLSETFPAMNLIPASHALMEFDLHWWLFNKTTTPMIPCHFLLLFCIGSFLIERQQAQSRGG